MELKKSLPKEILNILPISIQNILTNEIFNDEIEEVRIRVYKNIELIGRNQSKLIKAKISSKEIDYILNIAGNYSFYAQNDKIKRGYLTIEGGHRIGFSGSAVNKNDEIVTIRNINGLNIRIAREIKGSANIIMKYILEDNLLNSTLILSPPGVGKTTILRDIARQLANNKNKFKVGIIDERGEIASCIYGINQLDVGERSDVIDNCSKPEGIIMMIRSMSPNVIITDEVGSKKDIASLESAKLSGVKIIASAHSDNIKNFKNNINFMSTVENKIFDKYVFLKKEEDKRIIDSVFDKNLERIL